MTLRIIGVGLASGHAIQVMTEKPHEIEEAKEVTITGVKGVDGANGKHRVTPNGPFKLVLEESTFEGSYVTGGKVEY